MRLRHETHCAVYDPLPDSCTCGYISASHQRHLNEIQSLTAKLEAAEKERLSIQEEKTKYSCNEKEMFDALQKAYAQFEELKRSYAGAIYAIKQLQEVVPPKDWKVYAQQVLDLAATVKEKS